MNTVFTVNVYVGEQVINMPGIKGRENAIAIGEHFKEKMDGESFELIEEKEN